MSVLVRGSGSSSPVSSVAVTVGLDMEVLSAVTWFVVNTPGKGCLGVGTCLRVCAETVSQSAQVYMWCRLVYSSVSRLTLPWKAGAIVSGSTETKTYS